MLLYDAPLLSSQLSLGGQDTDSGCCLMEVQLYLGPAFRAEKRSVQASAHPLWQAQGGNFLCVDCVCLLLKF